MRLIDADALDDVVQDLNEKKNYGITRGEYKLIDSVLLEFPTIEERKTGKWIELTNTNHTYVCSVCGRMLVNITDGKNMVTENYPFCHCGADMRAERRTNE